MFTYTYCIILPSTVYRYENKVFVVSSMSATALATNKVGHYYNRLKADITRYYDSTNIFIISMYFRPVSLLIQRSTVLCAAKNQGHSVSIRAFTIFFNWIDCNYCRSNGFITARNLIVCPLCKKTLDRMSNFICIYTIVF